MLGAKLLLILVPILLADAQNNSPWRPGPARRLPFFRPGGRPGPFTVVTSVPVAPTTTEKMEIISEKNPPVVPPINNINMGIVSDITSKPQSIKPTELTIVYPENYKPVSSSLPPIQSGRERGPVRRPLFRPRPTIGSSFTVPTAPPPPPPTSPKPIESVTINIIPSAPPSTEFLLMPSTEKVPEIIVAPTSTASPFSEEPVSEEPISKEPEEPISKGPVSEEPISDQPISKQPISEQPISEQPISEQPISEQPISEQPISEQPISELPISEEPISEEPISEKPISEEPIFEEPISEEPISEEPISEEPISVQPTPINRPFNWHIIPSVTVQVPPITGRSPITISPPIVESVHPAISQRPPTSELPTEISPTGDKVNPSMDVFIPPVSSGINSAVIGGNKPPRQPVTIWHSIEQKPRTTLIPTITEVYNTEPTITQKPKGPNKIGHLNNAYAVNRLHDYICKNMDGYESVLNKCDSYIECKSNLAFQNTCPDGLHFNPAAQWPEYPCGYPSEVQCRSQDIIQNPQPSDQCPHRYGFYPMGGSDCGQYIMCQEGLATVMSCPPGLAFSPITSSCDWPANVPGCSPLIFREYTCPPTAVDKYGKQTFEDSKFRYGKSCKQYIVCHKGNPRLLSCDAGMSFDEQSETCVDADDVMDCQ